MNLLTAYEAHLWLIALSAIGLGISVAGYAIILAAQAAVGVTR